MLSQASVSSRDRLRTALDHREPDRMPIDFGSTAVTGIHVSCVAALRDYFGLEKAREGARAVPDAGLVDDDLRAAIGIDIVGVFPRKTMFGFPNADWKQWSFRGLEVLVPGEFPDHDGAERRHPDLPEGR